ncbi:hypothetical protein NERG_01162 [Nematocida ausubeli]|uniref:Uncharacterized protein n=1 Tax=Nematocida ausubeli (strain ATCC PRA-371 / ERTm2) TaxID=1913371 RepID=H8ZD15_NEMA1|nr:hypothetical protein NERG_01162 [Nematocida ausubeli]
MISRILLKIMMVQSVLTKISVDDIKEVHGTFIGEKQDMIINPEGPLNLLCGYIGHRNGYMHNKRFYSPEIETNYALSKKKLSSRNKQEYNFVRTPVNDKVYEDLDTKTPEDKYLSTYHMQLIKMFPSVNGDLSIEAGRADTLTNFLRAEHVKSDTKYILASLLLLSEGVDIKINIDNKGEKKKLVIKSKTDKEKVFVDVGMYAAGIDPFTNQHSDKITQKEASEIVNFYIRCRDKQFLKKEGKFAMPATREEFESGGFLNSAAFLIQTYIYEFIDTAHGYKEFVEAVYELLVDQMTKENSLSGKKKDKKNRIFSKLFLSKDTLSENIKYNRSLCDLVEAKNENAKFPFYNSSQLPQYTRVPQFKIDRTGFESSKTMYYSNCVETALLGLFCCLAYNPETKKYETSHMGAGISDELKEFFKEYSRPTETTDFEMHKKWCKVVACLDNDKIDYKQTKNELISGVANIFLAVAEITGEKKEILKLVKYIEEVCKKEDLNETQTEKITNMMESIIRTLSYNKDVEVECASMEIGERSNGNVDIFTEISIKYTFDGAENGISLDVEEGHTGLTLLALSPCESVQIQENYQEIRNIYKSMDSYTGYIVTQYVTAELNNFKKNCFTHLNDFKEKIDTILNEKTKNICKMFLIGKLIDTDRKMAIIDAFMIYTIEEYLAPNDSLTRFTANILGSLTLNDSITWCQVIKMLPFHGNWQKYFPKLGFKPGEHLSEVEIFQLDLSYVYQSIVIHYPASFSVKTLCNYLKIDMVNRNLHYSLLYSSANRELFNTIQNEGSIKDLLEIRSVIEETKKTDDLGWTNFVYISWFIHACTNLRPTSLEFLKLTYNFICKDDLQSTDRFKDGLFDSYIKKTFYTLKEKKSLLCSEDDLISVIAYSRLLNYFESSISPEYLNNPIQVRWRYII